MTVIENVKKILNDDPALKDSPNFLLRRYWRIYSDVNAETILRAKRKLFSK